MSTHTQEEMEKMSLEELKKNATEPEREPEQTATPDKTEPEEIADPETFVARREIDLGDGAGVQVFEGTGESEKEALEALCEKLGDAQLNASKKIRQQEHELRDFRARTVEPPKAKTVSDDQEFLYAQELKDKPLATLRKMWQEITGYAPEEFTTTKQAADAVINAQKNQEAADIFIATHPDFEDGGQAGAKNAALMKMKLAEMRLPVTSENLSKAYSYLKQSGLLLLKGGEANAVTDDKTKETERIAQPKAEAAQQRTRKASSIGTHSRTASVPATAELSEDEAYKLPMEKLRELANKQLAVR